MSEVLVFLANGSEEIESISIINILRRGGVNVKTISVTDSKTITGSNSIKIEADDVLTNLNEEELKQAKMIAFPGGLKGYESFKANSKIVEICKNFKEGGKYVAAICASPSFLGENGFLDGLKATCYPGFENNLKGAILSSDNVVVDKNFITGKGPGLSLEFGLNLLKVLKGEEIYNKVKKGLLL